MTVKNPSLTLFALLFTALGLLAQNPADPAVPAPAAQPPAAANPTPTTDERTEIMRRELAARLAASAAKTNAAVSAPIAPVTPPQVAAATPTTAAAAPATNNPDSTFSLKQLPHPTANLPDSIAIPSSGFGPDQVAIVPSGTATNADEMVAAGYIDFKGVDINQVLTIYAELVNKTILRPANLAAQTIFLHTQTPLTKKEAIAALDAVLGMSGIAMVNFGEKFVKADLLAAAPTTGAPFDRRDAKGMAELGSYVTHVVQLRYLKPSEVMPAITPLAKIPGGILPIETSQMLVLRDFTENVKRMLEMIREIDVALPSEFAEEVIPIKYALASEIASALTSLSTGGGGGPSIGGGAGGARSTTGGGAGRTGGTGAFGRSGTGGFGSNPYGAQPGMQGTGMTAGAPGGAPGGTGSSFTDRLSNIIKRVSATGEIQILGQTKIIADERTNSLLVFASKEDMRMVTNIISKLDVVLAQVLIEAVVIEVDLNRNKDFGVSYLQKSPTDSGKFTGIGTIGTGSYFTPGSFANGSGGSNFVSALTSGFNYFGQWNNDLAVSLTALAGDSHARILQRPRIQTSHGVTATLFVGESRPYPTSSYYGGGAYGGYSSIQQVPIGVTLEVTPLINVEGLVVMDIHQRVENVTSEVNIANVGSVPVTSQKDAQAKVAVHDRETIMLGGLIETTKSKSGSGVPWLMNVPVVGNLFRSTSVKEDRQELIVLIRPTVLPTPEVAALAATDVRNHMPGVRQAERDMRRDDQARQRASDKQFEKEKADDERRQHAADEEMMKEKM